MKKLVEVQNGGLESLIGERVLLMCMNYFYTGVLSGVNESCVELSDPAIVYETGPWTEKGFKDAQKLGVPEAFVQTAAIEAFFKVA